MWIEDYKGCGCSSEADLKGNLLGYCKTHGNRWSNRHFIKNEKVTHKKSLVERYTLRAGWWADITLSRDGFVNIQSDYGNYSYVWNSFGPDIKKFLIGLDDGYLYNKFGGRDLREFNLKKSIREVRKEIIQHRRDKDFNSKTCREFWDALDSIERDGYESKDLWYKEILESKLGEVYSDDPSSIPCIMDDNYQLTAFLSEIWPEFIEILKKEVE